MAEKTLFQLYTESKRPGRRKLPKDFTGERVGLLTVQDYSHTAANGVLYWRCRCDCGNEIKVASTDLTRGVPRSCRSSIHSPALNKDRINERFLNYLIKLGEDECWGWSGAKNAQGYGILGVKINGNMRSVGAHRLSHEYFTGPIPHGMEILHSCDNPVCTNPKHLRPGSRDDNTKDMAAKFRGSKKLTPEIVASIKLDLTNDKTRGSATRIAQKYGICLEMVCKIKDGRNWVNVPWPSGA